MRLREEYLDSCVSNYHAAVSDWGQPHSITNSYYWSNYRNVTNLFNPTVTESLDYGDTNISYYTGALSGYGVVPTLDVHAFVHDAGFDGSSGVGVGLLAARPESGLTVGVGYWATDMETLYRATDATTWESYYTPYTYPHPLRNAWPNGPDEPPGRLWMGTP